MPAAMADPVELEQVLHNLIRNASDSLADREGEKHILIRTFDAGDTVAIRVSDTGRGIPAEVLPRLFEPFFTTKPGAWGSGSRSAPPWWSGPKYNRGRGPAAVRASFVINLPAVSIQRQAAQ